jgi:hypothetical protein
MTLTPDDREGLDEECRRMVADLKLESDRAGNALLEKLITGWTIKIGDVRMRRLLASRAYAEEAVLDADPKLRGVALCVLTHYWEHRDWLINTCEQLALTDPDESVRDNAAYCLGVIVETAPDLRIARLLASIVRNELQPVKVRETAYEALFWLHFRLNANRSLDGIDRSLDEMGRHAKERERAFIDRLDWRLVDYFIQEKE